MGYRTIIARYVAKWGIAQMCLCKTKYQGGVSHHFGGVLASLKKYRAIWDIAAIVSPKGPKIEKIQDRPPGLKFSIEIENFKRATHQTPIFFCGEF